LRLSQREIAVAAGLSRAHVATIERARANPSLDVIERVSRALGLELELMIHPPAIVGEPRQRDLVHARCSGYVDRRLRAAGWLTDRETEILDGRSHGWIDLIAFEPRSGTLLVIELKTRLDDLGSVERQLGWYGRTAGAAARRLGWRPSRMVTWLLVLASDEVEGVLRQNSELLGRAFALRAPAMLEWLNGDTRPVVGRGLALIDPSSKRRNWLIRSRVDGRRSPSRYANYAAAARRFGS
jgi:transcriptional regulator with XRE-family HTH domain